MIRGLADWEILYNNGAYMTNLSVNLNKIALLRNSRGNNFPNLIEFAKKFIGLGVKGITVHPRQDAELQYLLIPISIKLN